VSEFVEECRREWKRLRVPGTIADEMADDLAADLEEAEADGASVEEVLGSGASNPRAFAAAWASERGIARPPRWDRIRARPLIMATFALLVLVAVGSVAIAVVASSGGSAGPRNVATTVAPSFAGGRLIGTYIWGANVPPSNIALRTGRRTRLHRRPAAIAISFGNSGSVTVERVTLVVQIGSRTYERTARHMVPNSRRTIRIALPAGLPPRFKITARTRPVAGEANVSNNQQTWKVALPN
jgi:hypothetical protein